MPITEQQVFDAAEQVRESGKVPSALSIREITQTGSLGTIQKFLRKWRHQETVSAASINPPPEPVLNAVRQFSEQLWQLALQHSEKAATLKVKQAREELQEAHRDTDEAMENCELLQQQLEEAKQTNAQLEKEQQSWLDKWQSLQDEKAQLQVSMEQLKHRAESLGEQNQKWEKECQHLSLAHDELKEHLEQSQCDHEALKKLNEEQSQHFKSEISLKNKQLLELEDLNKRITSENEQVLQQQKQREQQQEEQINSLQNLGEQQRVQLQDVQQQHHHELTDLKVQLQAEKKINQRLEQLLERLQPNTAP